jgi:hypothetical protein
MEYIFEFILKGSDKWQNGEVLDLPENRKGLSESLIKNVFQLGTVT